MLLRITLEVVAIRWRAAAPASCAEGAFGEGLSVCRVEAMNDLFLPRTLVFRPWQHHDHSLVFQLLLLIDGTNGQLSPVHCLLSCRENIVMLLLP
jgi:hypothetical protein